MQTNLFASFLLFTIDQCKGFLYNVVMMILGVSFKLFGLTINVYGLVIAIAMILAILLATKICRKRGLKAEDIYILALYIIPLSIIGARLYYVAFSDESFTFLEVFQIWKGGMAIYGGILGGILAVVIYCLIHKKNFLKVADVGAVALVLGQAIGRIACYFGGCCYGIEVTNPGMQWFPLSVKIDGVWHYSTFFYESICCFILFFIILNLYKYKFRTPGIITAIYLSSYGFIRCMIESIRGDSLYFLGMKVSQLLSLILMVVGIIMIIVIYTTKDKKKKVEVTNKIEYNNKNKNS